MTYITQLQPQKSTSGLKIPTMALLALMLIALQSSSANAQWTTGTNINNTNTGNVGVGTTAPSTKLEVVGNINAKLTLNAPATTNVRHIFNGASAWLGQDATNGELNFGQNLYYNSGFKYRVAAQAANIRMYQGAFQFQTAAAGSAGGAITWTDTAVILANGNVGIGNSSPAARLQVAGANGPSNNTAAPAPDALQVNGGLGGNGNWGGSPGGIGGAINFTGGTGGTPVSGSGAALGGKGGSINLTGGTGGPNVFGIGGGAGGDVLINGGAAVANIDGNVILANIRGKVGIGTINPVEKLEVFGNINVTGTGNINALGTITGGTIYAKYQDVAEWVPATNALPAGTVVTLDPTKSNHVEASSKAYDTRVAGVISSQPGIALGEKGADKVLVATTGRVRIKVDATRAPIQVGDLLVTSEVPGLAMKSQPINVGGVQIHRPGTLIGKALEPLAKGAGEILVLLSLQ